MKVKDEEHIYQFANPEKLQKLQKVNILQKHWDCRTGCPLLFLDFLNKSTQQLKANNRKLSLFFPLTSPRLCLQSGQLGRWSRQRSIHSLQKVWPHGVVTGSYNILQRKRPSLVEH